MKTEEELFSSVRERLHEETAHLVLRVDLITDVETRIAHHRRVHRSLTATVAAAVVVALVVPLVVLNRPPERSSVNPKTQTVAYVIHNADQALASIVSTRIIFVNGGAFGRFWNYDNGSRTKYVGGSPMQVVTTSIQDGITTQLSVDYGTHTWWTQTTPTPTVPPAPQSDSCSLDLTIDGFASATAFREQLAHQQFTIIPKSPPVNGSPTTELAQICDGIPVTRIYLNAKSGLPVRVVTQGVLPPHSSLPVVKMKLDYKYLTPTARNLALLNNPIPPGFTQVQPFGT
jgi:hypothetical protein